MHTSIHLHSHANAGTGAFVAAQQHPITRMAGQRAVNEALAKRGARGGTVIPPAQRVKQARREIRLVATHAQPPQRTFSLELRLRERRRQRILTCAVLIKQLFAGPRRRADARRVRHASCHAAGVQRARVREGKCAAEKEQAKSHHGDAINLINHSKTTGVNDASSVLRCLY